VPALLLLLAGFVGTELLRVGATVWLSVWTGAAAIVLCCNHLFCQPAAKLETHVLDIS
jgi:hypothetical protein